MKRQENSKKFEKKKARDKSYRTIINEYKCGDIDHKEYMRKIVKLRRMHDIPKTKIALLRRLEDSDSEGES